MADKNMRLLIVCQKMDEEDDLLGFFVAWIREFKKHFKHVDVIALHGSNIKLVRWMVLVWRVLWLAPRADAIFCHMSPIFAVMAGLTGRPTYLWYLHRSVTWKLKLAEKLSKAIFTADVKSLRLKSDKIIAVGHGIDVNRFAVHHRTWNMEHRTWNILSVGRISPIKDFETLLRAAPQATIVGRPIMSGDYAYFEKLKRLGGTFVGFVPYTQMPRYYANADIFVNCSPTGGLDKAVLEAMASGCIVLVRNEAFRDYLPPELFFGNLPEAIKHIQEKTPEELKALSDQLVQRVCSRHALSSTIKKITDFL